MTKDTKERREIGGSENKALPLSQAAVTELEKAAQAAGKFRSLKTEIANCGLVWNVGRLQRLKAESSARAKSV